MIFLILLTFSSLTLAQENPIYTTSGKIFSNNLNAIENNITASRLHLNEINAAVDRFSQNCNKKTFPDSSSIEECFQLAATIKAKAQSEARHLNSIVDQLKSFNKDLGSPTVEGQINSISQFISPMEKLSSSFTHVTEKFREATLESFIANIKKRHDQIKFETEKKYYCSNFASHHPVSVKTIEAKLLIAKLNKNPYEIKRALGFINLYSEQIRQTEKICQVDLSQEKNAFALTTARLNNTFDKAYQTLYSQLCTKVSTQSQSAKILCDNQMHSDSFLYWLRYRVQND